MYKKYSAQQQQALKEVTKASSNDIEVDVEKVVSECWNIIDTQCIANPATAGNLDGSNVSSVKKRKWKTVRLFVSSTFVDYFNEREVLVKKVIPELREWCEKQYIRLIECDLRWGVPKDSTTSSTISTCLEEIDRCRLENDNKPFFVNMLGDRYGWIPKETDVPSDIASKYQWVHNVSITHMEILVGAYRDLNPNALFMIRNSSVMDDIPVEKRAGFVDTEKLSLCQMKVLKQKLRDRFPNQVVDYEANFAGITTADDREIITFDKLDLFGQQVLEFFKEAIARQYPVSERHEAPTQPSNGQPPSDSAQNELDDELHEGLMEKRSQFVFGRDNEITSILKYVKNSTEPLLDKLTPQDEDRYFYNIGIEKYGCADDPNLLLCVSGVAGVGKSAVLASAASKLMQDGYKVLYHYIGATVDSTFESHIVKRLALFISEATQGPALKSENSDEVPLNAQLAHLRQNNQDRDVVIIIDGLNNLNDPNGDQHIMWLPPRLPSGCKMIVSASSEHDRTINRLRDLETYHLQLDYINEEARALIVNNFFAQYNKRLDEEQLKVLLSHRGSALPMWLAVSCEELRVYGDFRSLSKKINTLPESLDGLVEEVLSRLLEEDETGHMNRLLTLMYCSPGGVPESEVIKLLGNPAAKESATMMAWATLHRQLKIFIQLLSSETGNRIAFYNDVVRKAVAKKLDIDSDKERETKAYLANYYEKYCSNDVFIKTDLFPLLLSSGQKKRYHELFCTDRRTMFNGDYWRHKKMTELRCRGYITGFTDPKYNFKLCQFCAFKSQLFAPFGQSTTQCVLCGSQAPSNVARPAKFCMLHAGNHTSNMEQCSLCKRVTDIKERQMKLGMLCTLCGTAYFNRCCRIVTD